MAKVQRKRIGDILVETGVITPQQLAEALAQQRRTRERLGRILVEQGAATERQLAQALAAQLDLPLVSLSSARIDPAAVRLVPEVIARKRKVLPLQLDGGHLVVAMADPLDVFALDDVAIAARRPVKPVVAMESEVEATIERVYGMGAAAQAVLGEVEEAVPSVEEAEDAPVVRLVNLILSQAVRDRASDIHLEPTEGDARVRYRVDGVLHTVMTVPRSVYPAVVSRVKVLARLNIAERRLPQDGAFESALDGRRIDVRVSTVPTVHGERVALRLLDRSQGVLPLDQLGMDARTRRRYEGLIRQPFGIILVSGPTGSGKTTTLISTLAQLNAPDRNIITIEDPVEYQLPGVSHIQVNPRAGLTFATGLRSIVRQDPDIIMIGEIRDVETAEIAIHAALTGHLVLTTIHTNDAPSALTRLADMGIEPYLIASAVIGVASQRLVRLLCAECKQPAPIPKDLMAWLAGAVREPLPAAEFARPGGCAACRHTGYQGRTGIFEVLVMTDAVRRKVLARASAAEIGEAARAEGMIPMRADGMLKALRGLTTVEEVLRVTRVEEPTL
ncbi:MAG: GspE/PulE family protein [Armatimonadota bacterium]|nr:GspE/PulE family protein [Armatimonadota bacterium]MDR7404419.1 GspE/PulE family protein [Armatimonadota bacterium]MDR7472989.1 GspE/PulE family protein [Armatimonadota bacterium]MDR7509161.1 GspE/PulE family protein [Armatimonadota bacterium]MDR7516729.1 GspE/PulE family protein [Armatimonadota bacterium]